MLLNETKKEIGGLFNIIPNGRCSIHAMAKMVCPPIQPDQMAQILYDMVGDGLLKSYVDSYGYVQFKKIPYEECRNKCLHSVIFKDPLKETSTEKKQEEFTDLIIPLGIKDLSIKLVFTKGGQNPPWVNDNVWMTGEVQIATDEDNNIPHDIAFGNRLSLLDNPLTITWGCNYPGYRARKHARNGKTYKEAYEKIKDHVIPQIEDLKKFISERKLALENA